MKDVRSFFALLLSFLITAPGGFAQTISDKPNVPAAPGTGWIASFTRPYRQAEIPPVNLANSGRLESLVRAGKIYLSLEDTIALALENNLDLEVSRYVPQMAESDYLRATAGGLLRGVPSTVAQGPASALSQAGISGVAAGAVAAATSAGAVGGTVITQTGTTIPNLDPSFFFSSSFGHLSRPQANTVTSGGLTAVDLTNDTWNSGYQQQFLSGTTLSAAFNNSYVKNNNPFNDLNPNTTSNVNVQITQHILQGWGLAVNNRNIRVAKNNVQISDLTFKLQVMTTVSAVVNLYWDLVSFNQDLRVKEKALDVAKRFYEDNQKQVRVGTLAPIEVTRAEANVAAAEQARVTSEAAVLQQEIILKTALSRNGIASPSLAGLRIVPTDTLHLPDKEVMEPTQELIERALRQRPDVDQGQINIDNAKIQLSGSRSALLPTLDVQGLFQNNALTGDRNAVPVPLTSTFKPNPNAYFTGGYGNALAQIFRRNFPDYTLTVNLTMVIRNRTAQADYIRDSLTVRQQELSQQQLINMVRQNVANAVTSIESARAAYVAAKQQRILEEETLDAENKKYALGASTPFLIVQTQRDLATAEGGEVAALATYSRARVQMELLTADIFDKYHIEIAEAKAAKVARQSKLPPQ